MHNFQTNETMPWNNINKTAHQSYADWKKAKELYDKAHKIAENHNLTNDGSGGN